MLNDFLLHIYKLVEAIDRKFLHENQAKQQK